jgi:serine/threonine protein kinase
MKQVNEHAEILRQLNHESISRVDWIIEDTKRIYIIQQLCRGGSLKETLDKYESLTEF